MALQVETFAVETQRLRRIASFPEVVETTGYSRPSIYRLEKAGLFPRRVKIGRGPQGKVGFYADEIATWMASRAAEAVVRGDAKPSHDCNATGDQIEEMGA